MHMYLFSYFIVKYIYLYNTKACVIKEQRYYYHDHTDFQNSLQILRGIQPYAVLIRICLKLKIMIKYFLIFIMEFACCRYIY